MSNCGRAEVMMVASSPRSANESLLGPAKELQARYLPQIEQKARTIDAGQILQMVKAA